MAKTSDIVVSEIRDRALWVTINREAVRNALNDEVLATLTRAVIDGGNNDAIRAIVLTGAGDRAFCAGGDLKASSATFQFDYSRPSTSYADFMRAAHAVNVPMIARVNGHCMAGGMGPAGDLRHGCRRRRRAFRSA